MSGKAIRPLIITGLVLLALFAFLAGCEKDTALTTSASPSAAYAIDSSSCVACGLCVEACPHNAIRFQGTTPVIIQSRCQQCGACVNVCPQSAIR